MSEQWVHGSIGLDQTSGCDPSPGAPHVVPTIKVYGPLIRIGQPGTEKALLAAFRENGYEDMAECFLNSGNPKLVKAAQQWAADRGAWTLGVKAGELWGSK